MGSEEPVLCEQRDTLGIIPLKRPEKLASVYELATTRRPQHG